MNTPEDIEALANRIDHEELWRWAGMDHDKMTPEQKDRLWAGVFLRRHASHRGEVREALKKGAEFMRGFKLTGLNNGGTDRYGCGDGPWHGAINRFSDEQRAADKPWPRFMYTAKTVANEVARMILLFERERTTGMPGAFKMCAHDPAPATPLPDNHLRCALGTECRKCPYLGALDADPRMTPEAKDEAKAWTCATHILLMRSMDDFTLEQCLYDKSDDAFNDRMARAFGAEFPEDQGA